MQHVPHLLLSFLFKIEPACGAARAPRPGELRTAGAAGGGRVESFTQRARAIVHLVHAPCVPPYSYACVLQRPLRRGPPRGRRRAAGQTQRPHRETQRQTDPAGDGIGATVAAGVLCRVSGLTLNRC